jgi:cell division protein FtsZ
MSNELKFDFDPISYRTARLAVIGVGGAGGNAVGTMVEQNVENVIHMISNTDVQALERSKVPIQIQLGDQLTRGLGAGGNPNVGMKAAEESLDELAEHIKNVDMLFVTAGMGGGTGTGAAPVIARKATEMGILTVGVVTRPFRFEGRNREMLANQGIEAMKDAVNTLIVIPNQRLLELEEADLSILESFRKADEVLVNAVRGISDLITTAGYVNVDFADVRAIMSNMGMAIMGSGTSSGPDRALAAAREAISSPLLDNLNIQGAKGVLVNVTGSSTLSLREVDEAVGYIQESADPQANFIFGYVIDEDMRDAVKVTVVATGFSGEPADTQGRDERIRRRRSFQEELDIPAHIRQQGNRNRSESRQAVASSVKSTLPELPGISAFDTPPAQRPTAAGANGGYKRFIEPEINDELISIPSYRRRVPQHNGSKDGNEK